MSYYAQHIRPAMHADEQWQKLTRQIEETRLRLTQLEGQLMDHECRFICKMLYGPQPEKLP